MLKNLKLERANRSEEDTGGWSGAVEELEFRGDAFFQELVEAGLETLVFRGALVGEVGEAFGREAGDLVEFHFRTGGQGVAD